LRRTVFHTTDCQLSASSMRAPAFRAVICVLISEDSPNSLTMKHPSDVSDPFRPRQRGSRDF
jgi:hypothetical protein